MVAYYPGVHYELLALAAGFGGILSIEYLWSDQTGTDETTTTFSSRSLGDPHPNRRIVIIAYGDALLPGYGLDPPNLGDDPDIGYVKVGDKYAFPHVNGQTNYGTGDDHVSIHSVLMPTGTTADFVLSGAGANYRRAIAVYRIIGEHSMIYQYDWGNDDGTPSTYSMTLDLPENGVALFGVNSENDDKTFTPNGNTMQIDVSNTTIANEPWNSWAAGSTQKYGSLEAANNNYDAGGSLSSSDSAIAYCSISFAPNISTRPPVVSKTILSDHDNTNANNYTFSSRFIGYAQENRYVVVAAHAEGTGGADIPTVTLGGTEMNLASGVGGLPSNGGFLGVSIFWLEEESANNATIEVRYSDTVSRCWITVWNITNHDATTPIKIYSANTASKQAGVGSQVSFSIDTVAGSTGIVSASLDDETSTDFQPGSARVAARENRVDGSNNAIIDKVYYDVDSGFENATQACDLSFQIVEKATGVIWRLTDDDTARAITMAGVVFY